MNTTPPLHPGVSLLRVLLAAVLLAPFARTSAQDPDEPDRTRLRLPLLFGSLAVETAAITSGALIPYLGAGHFAQRAYGRGTAWALTEGTLIAARGLANGRAGVADPRRFPGVNGDTLYRRATGRSPAGEAWFRAGEFAYHTGFYARMADVSLAYRAAHRHSHTATLPLDSSSLARLSLAPVHPKDLASGWVLVPIALAGVSELVQQRERPLRDVNELTVLGQRMSRTGGALTALGHDALYLLSTAVGEELFFRGLVQTELTERWNPTLGIAGSTLAFAAFHIPNRGMGGALIAGVAGAYLGTRFHRNGYQLGELIAAHFWIDFLPGALQFLRDARSGRTVSEVRWRR
ncbi:MAG: CPBP family intramembrane metalloprotease [Gemmatimonadetes bacterium]|nr:CPBP family intramembrane metalloprotease [Gemmatimonadota bacterium]